MSRTIMAFDFGTKSIGSAIGQEITGTASPLKAFKANDGIPNWDDIEKQIKEWQPDLLVVGLPTDLHGKDLETITPRAKNSRSVCKVVMACLLNCMMSAYQLQKRAQNCSVWVATKPYPKAISTANLPWSF